MENKVCSVCKLEKNIIEFHKNSKQKDGYKYQCKLCVKDYNLKNKVTIKEYHKNYWIKNKEAISNTHEIWLENNKDYLIEYNKNYRATVLDLDVEKKRLQQYRFDNKEKISEQQRIWREDNKSYILDYAKQYRNENRDKINLYFINKYNSDPLFKLKINIRNSIRCSIKNKNYTKKSKSIDILGCSFEELKNYLESKFEPWMNWSNHGKYNGHLNYGWDIDHIIPLRSAKSEDEIIRLNHYTNLQPLCSKINRDIKKDH